MAEDIKTYIDEGAYNNAIIKWDKENTTHLKNELNSLSIRDRGELYRSVTGRTKSWNGLIYRVTKRIQRHGVFVEKGVGRGYPIESIKGNGLAISASGGKGRVPKPWFNPTIDKDIPKLADLVQKFWSDAAINAIMIK